MTRSLFGMAATGPLPLVELGLCCVAAFPEAAAREVLQRCP